MSTQLPNSLSFSNTIDSTVMACALAVTIFWGQCRLGDHWHWHDILSAQKQFASLTVTVTLRRRKMASSSLHKNPSLWSRRSTRRTAVTYSRFRESSTRQPRPHNMPLSHTTLVISHSLAQRKCFYKNATQHGNSLATDV